MGVAEMSAPTSWRDRLEALEALPVLPSLAIRFIELGKDPDSEIQDYVNVAQGDAALSTKLLAVGNSAWVGARHEVRTVKQAIGLLGTNNVRALAISYCLAGLHSVWKLEQQDADAYWQASLCKAAAAELLASVCAPKRAEEAFTMALFQDIGIGLLVAVGGEDYSRRLQEVTFGSQEQLAHELELFGADHATCGQAIATRLKLPVTFVESTSYHHTGDKLQACLDDTALLTPLQAAALLPHDIRSWKPRDIDRLGELLREGFRARWQDVNTFIAELQAKLDSLMAMLNPTGSATPSLEELVREACAENARCTATLVGQVQSLVTNNNNLAAAISVLTGDHAASEMRANRDPLTGLLNREGFAKLASHILESGEKSEVPIGLAMFDLDKFKIVNDTHGHACGDMLLKTVAARLRSQARSLDLVCRWGGDEIVVLLEGLSRHECAVAVERLQSAVSRDPVAWRDCTIPLRISAGLCWVPRAGAARGLTELIEAADVAMYQSKHHRDGTLVVAAETAAETCVAGGGI